MKTDFIKALIQLGAEELRLLTTEVKECVDIDNNHHQSKKQLTVAEFWNINRNKKSLGRRKYLTDQDI